MLRGTNLMTVRTILINKLVPFVCGNAYKKFPSVAGLPILNSVIVG